MKTRAFRELVVRQKAHQFVPGVYRHTKMFQKEEIFVLTSQFRREAISIAANIAEGYKRAGKQDKARFMNIAQGSLEECQYNLILSNDLEYGDNQNLISLLDEVSRMLKAYRAKILSSNS